MRNRELPKVLREAIQESEKLGDNTKLLVKAALERLWIDAVSTNERGHVFLSTGDIDAMWIRDSAWQTRPLLRFCHDATVATFLKQVIQTQLFYLEIDPFANAFNVGPNGRCWHKDFPDQSPWVFERKFELDSITGFWQLSLDYVQATNDFSVLNERWWELTESLVKLLWSETTHDPESYVLSRPKNPVHDSLSNQGRGAKFRDCGLIWSGFRPSDDACEMPFLVPSNIHAAILMRRIAALTPDSRTSLKRSCLDLANQIDKAIEAHAWVEVAGEKELAYEIDGLGGFVLMDDANYPNLLSLGFLGFPDRELAQRVRAFSLSKANPWYFEAGGIAGLGSPHTGGDMVWPLAIAMAGITSRVAAERMACLRTIEENAALGSIHESFSIHDKNVFTRDWFSWAEMTYFELVMQILEDLPHA
jgi:meiotically up-regulated gene 157 (Mug157) protein